MTKNRALGQVISLALQKSCFLVVCQQPVMLGLLLSALLTSSVCRSAPKAPPEQQNSIGQDSENLIKHGVVVEKVDGQGEAKKAGLQEGDILLAWSRGHSKGAIESPFDLMETESEQASLGAVKIEGLRGTEKHTWSLAPDNWGLTTRPHFAGELLSSYREGEDLVKTGKAEKVLEAAECWKRLANRYSDPKDLWHQVWLLDRAAKLLWGVKHWKEGDDVYKSAEEYLQRSIATIANFDSKLAIATNLNGLARISLQRADFRKAEQYYRQALEITERLTPESLGVAVGLMGLGNVSRAKADGEWEEEYYRRALAIRQRVVPGSLAVAASLTGLGDVSYARRDWGMAERYYRQALDIRQKLQPASPNLIASLQEMGLVAWQRRKFTKAQQYFVQALDIQEKIAPGSLPVVESFERLGHLSYDRGDLAGAERYYRKAIAIEEKLAQGNNWEAVSLSVRLVSLANLEKEQGKFTQAQRYMSQAWQIDMKNPIPVQQGLDLAVSIDGRSSEAYNRGDLANAEKLYYQAAAIVIVKTSENRSLDVAVNQSNLLELKKEKGDFTKAAERYRRQALESREHFAAFEGEMADQDFGGIWGWRSPLSTEGVRRSNKVAATLEKMDEAELFESFASQELDPVSIQHDQRILSELYERTVKALERQTVHLGGSEVIRSSFRAYHYQIYKGYVDLLLTLKQPEKAFDLLERSRARIFLETLVGAHVDIRKGADPHLLEERHALKELLAAKAGDRLRLLGEKNNEKQVATLTQEIEDLEKQYQDVEQRLRLNSPANAALARSQPLTLSEIQQLLDTETVLLEYSLGKKHSYVFVLTPTSVTVSELPEQAEIENAAKRLYAFLSSRSARFSGETRSERQSRERRAGAVYAEIAEKLSQMVLVPIAPLIKGKRLLIVSDGALQYVPFAALPEPGTFHRKRLVPLVVQHEIVSLPSASVLAILRHQQRSSQARKEVAVFADPVFDKRDPRVKRNLDSPAVLAEGKSASEVDNDGSLSGLSGMSTSIVARSVADINLRRNGQFYLNRLPFTRDEADAILTVVPKRDGMEALGFDAMRQRVIGSDLAQYRLVHFATHAIVDNIHPELSGLVLSLVDEKGNPVDGFLDLDDIYNLDLSADLVVLSACQTALGKEVNGEGLIGLTRGFMYAGAPRVISTLWKVDDFATAKLMAEFYKAMEQERMRPAQALRQAQLSLWKETSLSAPYYWAGFLIQGDWQ